MLLPNFLGIGAQRAGTTWLHKMLSRHPDIFLPSHKELHFFDERPDHSDYQGLGKPWDRPYYDMDSPRHWRWYSRQFKKGKKRGAIGEITPYYAVLSEARVALIAERLPHLKIIYIIRNPVKRAWSGFRLFWEHEFKVQPCDLPIDRIYKTIMHPAKLIHGDYQKNTRVWEKFFNDQICYLFYDDIVSQPQHVINTVTTFLNVDKLEIPSDELVERINSTPEIVIPPSIEKALLAYYSPQMDFIKAKFGRILTN